MLHVVEEQIVPQNILLSFIKKRSEIHEAKENIINIIKEGAESMLKDRIQKAKDNHINAHIEIRIGSPSKEIIKNIL